MCDQQSLRSACAYAQSDQSLCLPLEYSMIIKLLTEHHLEFLSLKGGCRGLSESTLVNMPHCWKSHALAQFLFPALFICLFFPQVSLCILGNFSSCCLLTFFKIDFFKTIFQEHSQSDVWSWIWTDICSVLIWEGHSQSDKRFGSRSGLTFFLS